MLPPTSKNADEAFRADADRANLQKTRLKKRYIIPPMATA
jgi:hypothetical protein